MEVNGDHVLYKSNYASSQSFIGFNVPQLISCSFVVLPGNIDLIGIVIVVVFGYLS